MITQIPYLGNREIGSRDLGFCQVTKYPPLTRPHQRITEHPIVRAVHFEIVRLPYALPHPGRHLAQQVLVRRIGCQVGHLVRIGLQIVQLVEIKAAKHILGLLDAKNTLLLPSSLGLCSVSPLGASDTMSHSGQENGPADCERWLSFVHGSPPHLAKVSSLLCTLSLRDSCVLNDNCIGDQYKILYCTTHYNPDV